MEGPNAAHARFAAQLRTMNVGELRLSDYCSKSLGRVVDASDYYLDIYRYSLEKALEISGLSPAEITIVDYGGGHGILSVLAKRLEFERVIYVDSNPEAHFMARKVFEKFQTGPDIMLQGDVETLKEWCAANRVKPDALLAMDVIEHIYVLDEFFAALHTISPSMSMVFTTASTPFNKRVVRRLHHAMNVDEYGSGRKKGFRQLRRDHILHLHPDMPDKQLDYWAENTRGLIYSDIERAVESQSPNLLLDAYNTCDPATGSWTERILPIDDYEHILLPYHFSLQVVPGRYNDHRHGPKEWMSRYYNKTIDKVKKAEPGTRRERRQYRKALRVAPFLYLIVNANR